MLNLTLKKNTSLCILSITPNKINSFIRCSRCQSDKYQHVNHNR